MRINIEPVADMLKELFLLDQEIESLLDLVNNENLPLGSMDFVAKELMLKGEQKHTILWMLEEEFINGLTIDEVLQNIQRAK